MSEPLSKDERCAWHADDNCRLESEAEAGCSNCSMLIASRECEGCGGLFLDWKYRGSDDVLSGPYATSDGDLVCERCCGAAAEREREEDDAWDEPDWDRNDPDDYEEPPLYAPGRIAAMTNEELIAEARRQCNRHDAAVDRCEAINSPTIENAAARLDICSAECERRGIEWLWPIEENESNG